MASFPADPFRPRRSAASAKRREPAEAVEDALFPWLSVRDTIEFPLRIRGWPEARRRAQVETFMEMAVIDVTEPRPRDVTSAEFNRVQRDVMTLLRPEIQKAGPGLEPG